MPLRLLLIAFSLFQSALAAEPTTNACESLLPPALVSKLVVDLPGYQLPGSADMGETRSKQLSVSGDWPCPFVVLGDFDGNGNLDRALLLKSRPNNEGTREGARLVGVLNTNGQWQITLSEDWPLSLADSELRPREPGFYQRADAINKPVEQFDQLASLQADEAVFSAGKVDGQYAVYAMVSGKWQKLTLRDQ